MRKTLALSVTCLILAAGTALAYDDCSCTCEGGGQQMRRADAGSRDGYFLRNGKVMVFRNGAATELTQDATFDNGMRLSADGTIVYSDGNRTTLRDSQMLAMDGQFFDRERVNAGFRETQNQGGRDGYFVGRNGKVMSFRDGKISEITNDITFDNGARLSVDGTFTMKDGTRSRLDNSQWMSFSGEMSNKSQTDNRNARDVSNQNNTNTNGNVNDANRNQSQRNDVNVDSKTNTNVNTDKHDNKVESKTNTNIDANRHDTTVESKTHTNIDTNKAQSEHHENKVEAPSKPATPDIKNDPNRNQAGRHENLQQPNTTTVQTPDIKNDANRNQAGRNDAGKADSSTNNSNASTQGRGTAGTPENQKKDSDQK